MMINKNTTSKKIIEFNSRVNSNSVVNDEYRKLNINFPLDNITILPGQFFHLLCPDKSGLTSYLRRPMSIYNFDYKSHEIEFLYKIHGTGTFTLSHLKKGEYLNVLGPLGNNFFIDENWNNILIVARGVGLATLLPVAKVSHEKKIKLTAILSARSPELLMSKKLFESFGAKLITITDAERNSSVENLENLINNQIRHEKIDCLFTCGSNRILTLLKKICIKHKIMGQIALEQQMACGLGMCFCCVREFIVDKKQIYKRVCKEGPIFNIIETQPWIT